MIRTSIGMDDHYKCPVKLNARQRVVFWMRFRYGMLQHEIADQIGVTQSAVSHREIRIREIFAAAGLLPPPDPRQTHDLCSRYCFERMGIA